MFLVQGLKVGTSHAQQPLLSQVCPAVQPSLPLHELLLGITLTCTLCVGSGGLKDVGLIQRLAKDCGVDLPLGKIMLDHLKEAGERGWTDLDWTAVSRVIREPAGIKEDG